MGESDDEYETRRLRDAVPRGLQSDYGAPPRERRAPPRDHLLGSTGEGRDKDVTPSNAPTDPIVQGDLNASSSGNLAGIIVVDGVLYNATVSGTLGSPV